MAYTRTWDGTYEGLPAGSNAPSTLATRIQQLKVDIRERMNSLVVDWEADPVVLSVGSIGPQTGVTVYIPAAAIQPVNETDDIQRSTSGNGNFQINVGNIVSILPVRLPVGVTITRLRVMAATVAVASMDFKLYRRTWGYPSTVTLVHTLTGGPGSSLMIDTGAGGLSETTVAGEYWIELVPGGGIGNVYSIHGFEFTINVPGLANYIG